MAKKTDDDAKIKEGKASSKAAEKAAKKNKTSKAAKEMADKAMTTIASELPGAGQAKSFMKITMTIDKLEDQRKQIGLAIRGERAILKEMKIDLRSYDHVRKLRKMEPADAKSFKASVALYEGQLGMELSPQQKELVDDINARREDARKLMISANGGDTGKEVGSGTMEKEAQEETDQAAIPEKNTAIGQSFKAPISASTH